MSDSRDAQVPNRGSRQTLLVRLCIADLVLEETGSLQVPAIIDAPTAALLPDCLIWPIRLSPLGHLYYAAHAYFDSVV